MKGVIFCAFLCIVMFACKVGAYYSWKEGGVLGVLAFSAALGVAAVVITALSTGGKK